MLGGAFTLMIRAATLSDLPELLELERRCFASDRLTRRQFHYMLTRANALMIVDELQGVVHAYALMLFSRSTSIARLYSLAVDSGVRGQGIGRRLVSACEDAARACGRARLRLEIRKDNVASIGLFAGLGYRRFGEYRGYYEDNTDVWRFEKSLGLMPGA